MRRLLAVAAIVVAGTAAQLGAAGSASAAGHGSAVQYQAPGYSMDFTGFTAADYTGPVDLGYWVCSGVRVTNKHFIRDNFTCSTTATDVTATFTDATGWPCGCTLWQSDYDGRVSTSWEVDISGGTVTGWAVFT
jgi:hypothetical protein